MAKVASLFGTPGEATRAMDALASSEFEDVEVRVFEPRLDDGAPGAMVATDVMSTQSIVTPFADDDLDALGTEERDFFIRGVRNGGTLVLAEVDDERADALRAFFTRLDGRTAVDD